ncbi:MAG: hypothetical protein J6N53_17040 [Lachnospiraceae bacterium]|nr:hypothetical protein [Lachnospiraceae bacterium]MBP3298010.1 hypothetical protein [Lachnospiraceae bacterium]
MSVLIFGVDDNAKGFRTLAVSGEATFHKIWEPAIQELELKLIGDQKWLYRKDLPEIREEFRQILVYAKENNLDGVTKHAVDIIEHLEEYWNASAPDAERLWMG